MKKVILITGASSGMGKETAKQLIRDGHTVYAVARRIDQIQDLKALGGHPLWMEGGKPTLSDRLKCNTFVRKKVRSLVFFGLAWM